MPRIKKENRKQAISYENAPEGSLWYIKHYSRDSVLTSALFHLIEGGNPDRFFDYKASKFDVKCVIVKLNGVRQVVVGEKTKHVASLFKVLVTEEEIGSARVGWVGKVVIERLEPFKCV